MSNRLFIAAALIAALVIIAASRLIPNDYFFSAAYTVLQFIILATAWNILGGYTGYVNFGSPAFFATGAYSTVFLYKALQQPPLIVMIVIGTLAAGLLGLPTLRLKLFSATVSGALMGMAGTTFPYYLSYVEPSAAFNHSYAVNSIAMPLIGGMMSWLGPLIGAVLLGSVQQVVQVTISSAWNLLIVGVLLVVFVTLAPNGIMGWVDAWRRRRKR